MTITVLYTDLRNVPSRLENHKVEWEPNLSAFDVLQRGLGLPLAQAIEADLKTNSPEIMVSWWNKATDDHSEIGGVGALDWAMPDRTVLTVSYENETTTQQQIDDSIEWSLRQEL